jgi:hypothetical protein
MGQLSGCGAETRVAKIDAGLVGLFGPCANNVEAPRALLT